MSTFANVNSHKGLDDEPVLILKNLELNKEVYIQVGQKIKIWGVNKKTVTGKFKAIKGDSITIIAGDEELKEFIFDISKFRLYSNSSTKRIIGGTIAAVGAAALVFGGISLVTGLAALADENIAAIILVAVPILGFGGYGLRKVGTRIKGKKYKIEKEWEMVSY